MRQKKSIKAGLADKKSLSAVAIIETILVVGLVWWLAYLFEGYWYVLVAACIAPFLLMYSPKSIDSGKKWLRILIRKPVGSVSGQWNAIQWLLFWLLLSLASFVIFIVSYRLSGYYITGAEGYTLLVRGFVVGLAGPFLAVSVVFVMVLPLTLEPKAVDVATQMVGTLKISGATAVAVGLFIGGEGLPVILFGLFGAGVGILLLVVVSAMMDRGVLTLTGFLLVLLGGTAAGAITIDVLGEGELPYEVIILATGVIGVVSLVSLIRHDILRTLLVFPLIPGYVMGCLVLVVLVHGAAILSALPEGFRSIISNLRNVVLHNHTPRPIKVAGLLSAHNIITRLGKGGLFQGRVVSIFLNFIWCVGSYFNRILIRSATWLWWPLLWIG